MEGEATPHAEATAAAPPVVNASEAPKADGGASELQKPKTRLLKDVEAEENAYLYKTLYQSLDTATDASIKQDFSESSDILAEARKAKAEFFRATGMPLGAKAKGCGALMNRLGEAKNKQVASVFFTVTMMMFTLPVVAVFVGTQVIAPRTGWDSALCGGFAGLSAAIAIMVGYTVYAFIEDAERSREESKRASDANSAERRGAREASSKEEAVEGTAHKKND